MTEQQPELFDTSNMLETPPLPPEQRPICSCGYPEDTFPCKIRHINLNTGDAKAANDFRTPDRSSAAVRRAGIEAQTAR